MPPMTRGPLPARVYWLRRIMVLGTALALVVAIAHLLGNGSDASDGTAEQSAAETTPTTSVDPGADLSTSTTPKTGKKRDRPGKGATTSEAPVLAEPQGECSASDLAVAPKVENAVAGRDVMIVLQLRTMQSPACTFAVSSHTLTVNITSGQDDIWSSLDCPRAIPKRQVVVRDNVTTKVGVVWSQAKRSGDRCVIDTDWAMPGWYHATAAALAGEPADTQFELTTPVAGTITRTATPTESPSSTPTKKPSKSPSKSPSKKPSKSPSKSPSGAVEPD
ncbi:hypothetical protein [Nocardioides mangrovi]|uniref:DUF4232 domain-containing protein n=1 Tax=Nocardioides mangrovi TaxID=2874580 RepID=A0ABS7UEY6_9ACTN|nr:hypothetical protein [Nocardioides mangrovi]MBZ5739251.1 hypothetical protein [Nocardioides mangrovi]